uniref:Serrate RNA effector molecule homolog isoform X2 n=1 Tax=Petromyzon marinus TaxID=7757 RepID=A0AAJ7TU05_PETMA|nr:serrate RNA effector molecule homolog isoform X2 [Petromyzon marinus]
MAESDDEYDRRRRDKFRRERSDHDKTRDKDQRRRSDTSFSRDHRKRESERDRGRKEDYRDYDRNRWERYSPRHEISPPPKRMRREWEERPVEPYRPPYDFPAAPQHFVPPWGHQEMHPMQHHGIPVHARLGNMPPEMEMPPPPPTMKSFKEFLVTLDDAVEETEAVKLYSEYKQEFQQQQMQDFFLAHKGEEWFRTRYHPDEREKRRRDIIASARHRVAVFCMLKQHKWLDNVTLDLDKTDQIAHFLDAASMLMEGGTAEDLKALELKEEPPKPVIPPWVSLGIVPPMAGKPVTPTPKASVVEPPKEENVAPDIPDKEGEPAAAAETKEEAPDAVEEKKSPGEDAKQSSPPEETRRRKCSRGSEEDEDEGIEEEEDGMSSSESEAEQTAPPMKEEPSDSTPPDEEKSKEESVEPESEKSVKQEREESKEECSEKPEEVPKEETTKGPEEEPMEESTEELKKESNDEPKEKSKEDPKEESKEELKAESKDGLKEESKEELKAESKDGLKEESKEELKVESKDGLKEESKEDPKEELKEESKGESKEESKTAGEKPAEAKVDFVLKRTPEQGLLPRPRNFHRNMSIFLRNIAPYISKAEIVSLCRRFPGFMRVALSEPQPERGFYRRGWVTFSGHVNIQDICWNLQNVKLRECELSPVVNRDLARRMRIVSGVSLHATVARNHLRLALKLVHALDRRAKLWEYTEGTTIPGTSDGANPLLGGLSKYLEDGKVNVDEDAAKKEQEAAVDQTAPAPAPAPTPLPPPPPNKEFFLEKNEDLLKMLDQLLFYLRIVHSVDFYNHTEYPHEDEMPNRCGMVHVRGPQPCKLNPNEVAEFERQFETKLRPLFLQRDTLDDEEAEVMGRRDPEQEVEKFISANCQEQAKDKWHCPLSGKKFQSPEYVRKHIMNKHLDKVEEVRKEVGFFNNFLMDKRRPHLMEPRFAMCNMMPGIFPNPQALMPSYNFQRLPMPAYGGSPYPPPQQQQQQQPPPQFPPRGGFDPYRGQGSSHYIKSRRDFRPMIQYTDLDAPEENDFF